MSLAVFVVPRIVAGLVLSLPERPEGTGCCLFFKFGLFTGDSAIEQLSNSFFNNIIDGDEGD